MPTHDNKRTNIVSQTDVTDVAKKVFADTDTAIAYFFTSNAKAVFDACCTQLQWALVADDNGDNTKVKYTLVFGSESKVDQFADAEKDSSNWGNNGFTSANSSSHLF
tara:strand:+ start:312 stop:632 length:321 start_codon:yes stop_codon:yes gene_type:complete